MVDQIGLAITLQVMRLQLDCPANGTFKDAGRPWLRRAVFEAPRVVMLRKPHLDGSYQPGDLLHLCLSHGDCRW